MLYGEANDFYRGRKALRAGAYEEENAHAVLLSLTTTGFPNMIAALQWDESVLEEA